MVAAVVHVGAVDKNSAPLALGDGRELEEEILLAKKHRFDGFRA